MSAEFSERNDSELVRMVQGNVGVGPFVVGFLAGVAEKDLAVVLASAYVVASVAEARIVDPLNALCCRNSQFFDRSFKVAVVAPVEFRVWRRTIL
jgi:hypothetical protein